MVSQRSRLSSRGSTTRSQLASYLRIEERTLEAGGLEAGELN
jgi:hypothetical protein